MVISFVLQKYKNSIVILNSNHEVSILEYTANDLCKNVGTFSEDNKDHKLACWLIKFPFKIFST